MQSQTGALVAYEGVAFVRPGQKILGQVELPTVAQSDHWTTQRQDPSAISNHAVAVASAIRELDWTECDLLVVGRSGTV